MNKISEIIGKLEKPNFPFRPNKQFYKEIEIGHKRFWAVYKKKSNPSIEEVQKIANYFNFNPNDLIDFNSNAKPHEAHSNSVNNVENPKQIKLV